VKDRVYHIQIHVGDLDHALMAVPDTGKAAWLSGFQLGLHGIEACSMGNIHMDGGNEFGLLCYLKTKGFLDAAAEGGRRSAEVRRKKNGTAQPPKGVRENTEGGSKGVRESAEVTYNLKPITLNLEQETISRQVAVAPKRFTAPSVEDVTRYCEEHGYTLDAEKFCLYYESNGWKVGKNPMKNWQAAVRTWVKNDQARTAEKGAQCPYPAGSYEAMDWWVLNSAVGAIK